MEQNRKLDSAFWALRLALGGTAFLAGADKFTNLMTRWGKYISPEARKNLPVSSKTFMRTVGVIEMLVGIGILSPRHRVSSYAASAWLIGIAANLLLNQDYDIAARDVNIAIAAFALGQLGAAHERDREENDLVKRHLNVA
jgi:uncharacterized membrane protein YphA (DoxX/SURF4 family)